MYISEKTTGNDHMVTYQALNEVGDVAGFIEIDHAPSIPEIKKVIGDEKVVTFLLNWIVPTLESACTSKLNNKKLMNYGFEVVKDGLVWDVKPGQSPKPKKRYGVWVQSPLDAKPFRLEVSARNKLEAKMIVKQNFPKSEPGYVDELEHEVI